MMRCPNPDCPYAKKHGHAADYRDGMSMCSDCGTTLIGAYAETPALPMAVGAGYEPGPARPFSALLVKALVVSILGASLGPILGHVPLPFIDFDEVRRVLGDSTRDLASLSIGAIGITPWISATLLVEFIALLAPRWRALRHDGPIGRAKLLRVSTRLGVFFALVQGWMLTSWLAGIAVGEQSFAQSFAPELYGVGPKLLLIGSIAAASCVLRLGAAVIERAGVGNGFSVVIGGAALLSLLESGIDIVNGMIAGSVPPVDVALSVGCLAAVTVTVWRLVRPLDDHEREFVARPSAGFLPTSVGVSASLLPVTIAAFVGGNALPPDGTALAVLGAMVALVAVPLFGALFSSPARAAAVRARLESRDTPSADDNDLAKAAAGRALVSTMILNGVLIAVWASAQQLSFVWDVLAVATLVAIAKDIVSEIQARRSVQGLVPVWPLHRFDHVGPMLAALRGAGIDAHLRGAHHRVLFHFFAPYVAIDVLVDVGNADRATSILKEITARLARS